MIHPKDSAVLIIGAGCFGISTAYHLLNRGFQNVTVLEKSSTLLAKDAASNDINRVIRTSYNDKFYTSLAKEAILSWKNPELWGSTYHESGVLFLGTESPQAYVDDAYENDVAIGAKVQKVVDSASATSLFPPEVKFSAPIVGSNSYFNWDGGWANAGQGMERLTSEVIRLGARILTSKTVKRLLRNPDTGRSFGVGCEDGSSYRGDLIILATGSWTSSAFSELDLSDICLATGQSVALIQLSEEEAGPYKRCPVVLDFGSGFYIFPPNEHNIVKMAIHTAGHTVTKAGISTPRTHMSDGDEGLLIPKTLLQKLRAELRKVYPDLAAKPFCGTRLCWYSESPDSDFIIGRHPKDDTVLIATGGSGHAYKFLPVLGRLVADAAMNLMEASVAAKFSLSRNFSYRFNSRDRQELAPVELDIEQLCSAQDLLAI